MGSLWIDSQSPLGGESSAYSGGWAPKNSQYFPPDTVAKGK